MKDPKEMTREELADKLDALGDWLYEEEGKQDENIREAASRLRNSVDRPKIELYQHQRSGTTNQGDEYNLSLFWVSVNGVHIQIDRTYTPDDLAVASYDADVLNRAIEMGGDAL